jgi:hypothetical protein
MTQREIYNLYRNLKLKCNPKVTKHPLWKFYGKLGVQFRFKSVDDFSKCIGPAPSPKHKLQRWPDTHGHYEVGNVRWIGPDEPWQKRATRHAGTTKQFQRPTPALPPLTPAFW